MKRMAFLIAPALVFLMAQGGSPQDGGKPPAQPVPQTQEELLRRLAEQEPRLPEYLKTLQPLQPDVDSENWKELSADLGVWVYRDGFGVLRGRMFVRHDERWFPIAVEGLEDLGPEAFPAK